MINRIRLGRMAGLTLVELLVSMTLSILLLTGAISIFLASKESFNVGDDLSRVQESVRFATARIFNDVSQAGFVGCTPFPEGESLVNISTVPGMMAADDEDKLGDFSKAIIGGEEVGPNNSDRLTVHFAEVSSATPLKIDGGGGFFGLIRDAAGDRPNLTMNMVNESYDGDEIIVLSDCSYAIYSQLTASPSGGLQHTGIAAGSDNVRLGNKSPANYYKMDGVTYQLDTTGPDANGKYVSRLMATRLSAPDTPQPILDGVEDFQVEYGIDLNGDLAAERYLNWDQIIAGNFQPFIASVRILIVTNSGKPQADTLGRVVDTEKSMVKSSVFTIALRNRGNS
ncbi:MAG: PilW family protein [Candidatus Polarisedimenticolaceae bacterium]|nr:PilW family protein [Candidatus Polarisedimenticolaceae bacterium]